MSNAADASVREMIPARNQLKLLWTNGADAKAEYAATP
jgi:hypothetical protein